MISNIGEGATPLMYACQQSREREVLDLIARKRNAVRERDRTLKTPLHYCTENATIGCAEAVLRAAPELLDAKDEDGYTALHLAVIAGNKTFLRFLISRGANVNALDNEHHSAVHWATVCGEEEALDIVLRAGANISTADIHGGYPLHYAAQMCGPGGEMGRDPKIGLRILNILLAHDIEINVKDKDGRQPILWAASAGSADAILALVKAGASVEASDKDGLTALHCAASRGHTDCIETLVTLCGANIDVIDSNGCTALFYAVTLGHADATQLLLSLGAEPNRQDRKGRTPAHCGAAKGQLETLKILQNYGANLWLRNVKGDFPLHEAIASGRRDLVRWLLNQRPDSINVGNNDGRCPIHIAAINNNIDMVKILLDSQSLVNPIMRTTKGILMTPLDAALHRGFRGCAKYLQLHGGVPFTKLTEKSSNIKGISSRLITSDMYADNYSERVSTSNWGAPQPSSTTLPTFVPAQIKIGGDNAIQQIETTEVRAVTRIHDDYQDFQNSDEEKIYRRRRRRKKWEHQKKGYISEEDSNIDEHPRRRYRDEDRRKREQYDESSSENEYYKRKTMRKKSSTSDSEERNRDRRKYYSATEDSENERRRERKRKPRKEGTKIRAKSEQAKRDRSHERRSDSEKEKEVRKITVAEVHADPETVEIRAVTVLTEPTVENVIVQKEEESNAGMDDGVKETEEEVKPEEKTDNIEEVNNAVTEVVPEVVEDVASSQKVTEVLTEVKESVIVKSEEPKEEEMEHNNTENVDEDVKEGNESEKAENLEEVERKAEPEVQNLEGNGSEVKSEENKIAEEENGKESEENKEKVKVIITEDEATENSVQVDQPLEEEPQTISVVEANEQTEDPAEDQSEETKQLEVENTEDAFEDISAEMDDEKIEDQTVDEEEEEDDEEEEEQQDIDEEEEEPEDNAFEVLDNEPNSAGSNRVSYIPENRSRRGSDGAKEYRDVEGSIGEESGGSTRNEDSSALMDSGIEPSPRRKLKDCADTREGSVRSRVPRLCNRGKDPEEIHTVSVTQTVQNTIRKYHMERKIFYQLLELKRLQIRAGRANEQVLVKRLVDEYRRGGIIPGLKNYSGQYTFRQFEKFLYDQLRTLQSTAHILIPKLRPSDDIETLSTILRKTRVELVDDIPENPMFCTQGTHRCHHAAHAYTGIPCAAYITKFNHHEMPKTKTTGFLPQIDQSYTERVVGQQGGYRPVTLEVSHGKEKQVISLPTDRLDKNKRYYVTFTIKGGPPLEETKTTEERMLRHRHAKSF